MAHVAADRVKETTTTTGTGTLTLDGAVSGFQAFSAVMANNDTTFYTIVHRTATEWETVLGTWATGGTLARTTVIASSNSGNAVDFSAGTKDVFITSPAQLAPWSHTVLSPSTDQNNYAIGGAAMVYLTPTATISITGIAGGYAGRRVTLHNANSDYLVILPHENTSSTAANRFDMPNKLPLFLMPGDRAVFVYDPTESRWDLDFYSGGRAEMGLTVFEDFIGAGTIANNGAIGPFGVVFSGAAASVQASTYLVNTTEKPIGVLQMDTGTTATARATVGTVTTAAIVPTLGPALFVSRLAVETTTSGTETLTVIAGFQDASAGTFTDGAAWENRWTGSAAEWSQTRAAGAAATRSNTGSPSPDNNYIWLIVFLNSAWTRADFIYSTDSMAFTKSDSPTTGLPGNTQYTGIGITLLKSVGTTQRNVSIDFMGYRVDHTRG